MSRRTGALLAVAALVAAGCGSGFDEERETAKPLEGRRTRAARARSPARPSAAGAERRRARRDPGAARAAVAALLPGGRAPVTCTVTAWRWAARSLAPPPAGREVVVRARSVNTACRSAGSAEQDRAGRFSAGGAANGSRPPPFGGALGRTHGEAWSKGGTQATRVLHGGAPRAHRGGGEDRPRGLRVARPEAFPRQGTPRRRPRRPGEREGRTLLVVATAGSHASLAGSGCGRRSWSHRLRREAAASPRRARRCGSSRPAPLGQPARRASGAPRRRAWCWSPSRSPPARTRPAPRRRRS